MSIPGIFRSLLLVLLLSCVSVVTRAQTIDVNARTPAKSPIEGGDSKKQREAEKKKQKQKEEGEKAIEKGRKQHMSYQDKATRRRMKKSKKRARDFNHQ